MTKANPREDDGDRSHLNSEAIHNEDATYVAFIHGIGATSGEAWSRQSSQALRNWWITVNRGVKAEPIVCPEGCGLGASHEHLRLSTHGYSRRVDLEALFWGDCVCRPGAGRCAWLVLQAGLLLGLIDTLAAGLTAFERFVDFRGGFIELAHSTWQLVSTFLRAVMSPALTLFVAVAVLVNPRLRATIGDALAWSTDEPSRERVKRKLTDVLRDVETSKVVLIGHSQGGSIAAELEPALREDGREVRLVTLGSGHGLLAAMHTVLPRWSIAKSLLSWAVLLAFSVLTIATLVSGLAPALHPVAPLAAAPVRLGGYMWLSKLVPLAQSHGLLLHGANVAPIIKDQLSQPFYLPPVAGPTEIVSTALGMLLIVIGPEPARRLRAATHTEAPGIDIVATHDLVAAAMLQLGPPERRRRVSQCGSLLLDHTSYLRNGCVVLGLLAEQIERAAGLPEDDSEDLGALATEEYHRAGLALRGWTRPLLFALIVGSFAWFAAGRVAPVAWVSAAGACCLAASLALTASSVRWLTRALQALDAGYWTAVVRERERWRRARSRWAGVLALASTPLIGGAAVAFSTPAVLHLFAKHPGLAILTLLACVVGGVLCILAWRSLFGFQRQAQTTIVLALAALLWLLQGRSESSEVAALMLALACWSYRRDRRERQLLAMEWNEASDLLTGVHADASLSLDSLQNSRVPETPTNCG
jgi:hypothetical protein